MRRQEQLRWFVAGVWLLACASSPKIRISLINPVCFAATLQKQESCKETINIAPSVMPQLRELLSHEIQTLVVLSDWRTLMASPRGTIHPVSSLTFHSLMCLHLEAVLLLGEAAVSRERDREHSLSLRPRAIRQCRLVGALVVLLGLLFMSSPRLTAQSTFGSIRGTAQDTSGAAIPDTQITLHSIDQNTDRAVKTNATGDYAFENLLAGQYSLRAQHDGFADTQVDGITLAARQDSRHTLTMAIAAQATTVQVTSSANQIDTENGVIGDAKNTADIGQLPLNFRASTTSPLASLETSPNVQTDSQGNIAIGGATSNMIGFSVDGISTTNVFNSAAGTNPYPSPEGIAELKVTAFNNNAEFAQVG